MRRYVAALQWVHLIKLHLFQKYCPFGKSRKGIPVGHLGCRKQENGTAQLIECISSRNISFASMSTPWGRSHDHVKQVSPSTERTENTSSTPRLGHPEKRPSLGAIGGSQIHLFFASSVIHQTGEACCSLHTGKKKQQKQQASPVWWIRAPKSGNINFTQMDRTPTLGEGLSKV